MTDNVTHEAKGPNEEIDKEVDHLAGPNFHVDEGLNDENMALNAKKVREASQYCHLFFSQCTHCNTKHSGPKPDCSQSNEEHSG